MIRRNPIRHDPLRGLPSLRELLENDRSVVFTYLFGSYGQGNPGPLSDVDLAIFIQGDRDPFEKRLDLVGYAMESLGTDEVDLVILNEAPLSLAFHVLHSGKDLFSRDEDTRLEWVVNIRQRYFDTAYLREIAWGGLVQRIREGRFGD